LRERALRELAESGRPLAHVARDLGIHRDTLRYWVGRERELERVSRSELSPGELRLELARLQRENAELRRANEILKDASVYFAQELDPTRRR
jgi:transposase